MIDTLCKLCGAADWVVGGVCLHCAISWNGKERIEDKMDFDDDVVRCPKCGCNAADNLFFADDDVDQEHPFCECGYERPVAVDIEEIYPECPECGCPMRPGNVWPHDYLSCGLCGHMEDYIP